MLDQTQTTCTRAQMRGTIVFHVGKEASGGITAVMCSDFCLPLWQSTSMAGSRSQQFKVMQPLPSCQGESCRMQCFGAGQNAIRGRNETDLTDIVKQGQQRALHRRRQASPDWCTLLSSPEGVQYPSAKVWLGLEFTVSVT